MRIKLNLYRGLRAHDKSGSVIALSGILVMVAAMLVGPALSPPEYEWMRHSVSEQAGQLIEGAWAMRLGFFALGGSVVVAAVRALGQRPILRAALVVFGAGMIGAAVWSHAPFLPNLPANTREDQLHSVASSVAGIGFAASCAAALFEPPGARRDLLTWLGLIVSVVIPLAMLQFPAHAGLLQRVMFVVSFAFISRVFLRREF